VPYLNVTARWDGAPDQGLITEKGGRGFPFCVVMDAAGEVLWEVRPTSLEVLEAGLADARELLGLKRRLAAAPDDAALGAAVALLSAMGCDQRQTRPVAELEALARTEGLDPAIRARFDGWVGTKRFQERLEGAMRAAKSPAEFQAACLALYDEGVRPPEKAAAAISFWHACTVAAIDARDAAKAKACLAGLEACAAGREGKGLERVLEDLRQKLEALGS
jgi:hypothetical protein